ncbi:MAG: hypothetical protein ACREYF_01975 [Gammaproteobacteria bacterium]
MKAAVPSFIGTRNHSRMWSPWEGFRKRMFDIEQCLYCSGTLQSIAAVGDAGVIAKILTHLGLPARAPPRSPARSFATA